MKRRESTAQFYNRQGHILNSTLDNCSLENIINILSDEEIKNWLRINQYTDEDEFNKLAKSLKSMKTGGIKLAHPTTTYDGIQVDFEYCCTLVNSINGFENKE